MNSLHDIVFVFTSMHFFSVSFTGVFYWMHGLYRYSKNSAKMSTNTLSMGRSSYKQKLQQHPKLMFFFCLSLCNEYMAKSDN